MLIFRNLLLTKYVDFFFSKNFVKYQLTRKSVFYLLNSIKEGR